MGAAVTYVGNDPAEILQDVQGDPSSTTAELVALRLAVENSPPERPLIILTDSHNALTALEHCRRTVFRSQQVPRESLVPLQQLVQAINAFAEDQELMILKVRAHSGHPLNERADELAGRAALQGSPHRDQPAPTLHCRFRYGGAPATQWNARLSGLLVQEQATRTLVIPQPRALDDDTDEPDPSPATKTQQWLTTEGAYRPLLGSVLRSMDYSLTLKRTMQAISHSYPTQAKRAQWDKGVPAACPLGCGCEKETLAHLQCECPCTKEARIAVHHDICGQILDAVESHLPPGAPL